MTVTFPSILKGDLRVSVATPALSIAILTLSIVIPALSIAIPALSIAIPALNVVIPANAGIQRGWNRACKAELSGG